jgi:hypothetical protein
VVVVVITLPVLALWRPAAVVGQNQLETSPEDAAINRRTARILAQLAFLVVAGPTCVILGSEQARANGLLEAFTNLDDFVALPGRYWADLIWVVGWLMLPLGLLVLARTIIWGTIVDDGSDSGRATALVERRVAGVLGDRRRERRRPATVGASSCNGKT